MLFVRWARSLLTPMAMRALPTFLLAMTLGLAACTAPSGPVPDQGPSDPTTMQAAPPAKKEQGQAPIAASASGDPSKVSSGITSCQPKFETACKPPVIFENGDPSNRGKIFTDAIPDVEKTMQELACTTCSILYRDPGEIPSDKHPKVIRLVLDTHGGVAQAGGDTIQFDLDYIAGLRDSSPADIKRELLGVLQHESVHLYQNDANVGTTEGLADLVRARTGYYTKDRWQPHEGFWTDPYTASGNFYSWLTGPCAYSSEFYPGSDQNFPYKLNKALAGTSGEDAYTAAAALIEETFGRTPEQLWYLYQDTAF